ncbi:hypothetical protein ISG08_01540 [Burkholderia pseudomallei]|uniref:hypothetical protein n=1 Tax=pseudomallei group TaxID=111527 RepID=UPI00050F7430|nr:MULTISPECIES: hypothetical protein [pseudomallei group]KGD43714.1 hypothetical protein DO72_5609 [Burkholderia pseudomallei]KOT12273.1 hypothetical protein DM77_3304 [Burkholderia mallei]MBF3721414.1 hypothetical protein [Burkholderia pseudomallei]MBF3801712.1 hypothetical protein [Burkholderia pseudomallei]MBF3907871.1 hypothetical protein [Burkholderia pseudomallei]
MRFILRRVTRPGQLLNILTTAREKNNRNNPDNPDKAVTDDFRPAKIDGSTALPGPS